jgi:hypothetical protein
MQGDALRVQQVQAQLESSVAPTSHLDAEETQCVVCFDAPKEYAIVPCGHQCVCGACAEQLTKTRTPLCPVCREPIIQTMKVFCSNRGIGLDQYPSTSPHRRESLYARVMSMVSEAFR